MSHLRNLFKIYFFPQGTRYKVKGTVLSVSLPLSLLFTCGASADENSSTYICQQLKSSSYRMIHPDFSLVELILGHWRNV